MFRRLTEFLKRTLSGTQPDGRPIRPPRRVDLTPASPVIDHFRAQQLAEFIRDEYHAGTVFLIEKYHEVLCTSGRITEEAASFDVFKIMNDDLRTCLDHLGRSFDNHTRDGRSIPLRQGINDEIEMARWHLDQARIFALTTINVEVEKTLENLVTWMKKNDKERLTQDEQQEYEGIRQENADANLEAAQLMKELEVLRDMDISPDRPKMEKTRKVFQRQRMILMELLGIIDRLDKIEGVPPLEQFSRPSLIARVMRGVGKILFAVIAVACAVAALMILRPGTNLVTLLGVFVAGVIFNHASSHINTFVDRAKGRVVKIFTRG